MAKKLSMTQRWMLDHPNDEPPPADRRAAQEWRQKRWGAIVDAKRERDDAARRRYEKALQESLREEGRAVTQPRSLVRSINTRTGAAQWRSGPC